VQKANQTAPGYVPGFHSHLAGLLCSMSPYSPLKGGRKLPQIHAERPAEAPQLHHINTPLATLALANERLCLP